MLHKQVGKETDSFLPRDPGRDVGKDTELFSRHHVILELHLGGPPWLVKHHRPTRIHGHFSEALRRVAVANDQYSGMVGRQEKSFT